MTLTALKLLVGDTKTEGGASVPVFPSTAGAASTFSKSSVVSKQSSDVQFPKIQQRRCDLNQTTGFKGTEIYLHRITNNTFRIGTAKTP